MTTLANSPALQMELKRIVEEKAPAFQALSDAIWGFAELGFEEARSCEAQIEAMAREGFRIERNAGGLPTAFMAEYGSGGPIIALLGEYDALAGLSQHADEAQPRAVVSGMPGHGCGHNLLGAGAALAAASIAETLRRESLPGRVRYYGCPAEEGGGGKAFMVREGAFDGVDAALTWHPAGHTGINFGQNLAFIQAVFRFSGTATHAALSPHLGRSALDAAELMNVGANFLREHIISEARIHYAFRDAGGRAANVVQAHAELGYIVRAPNLALLQPIYERIRRIAQGAAMMTDTVVEARVESGMSDVLLNRTLSDVLSGQIQRLGGVPFTDADESEAKAFVETLSPDDIRFAQEKAFPAGDVVTCNLHKGAATFDGAVYRSSGSTDVGDVSWVVPTAQFWGATCAMGTPFHSWQMVAQGKTKAAHAGVTHAAAILAASAVELFTDTSTIERAKKEHAHRRAGRSYVCPIPADVPPPLPAA